MENDKSNILYVDDEQQNLVSFEATFRRYYNVFTARSAAEGVNIMRQQTVKTVIADQRMPEMTGVQFFEALIPEFPMTSRMLLTGFSDLEAIVRAINTGRIFRYLNKPWDEQELKMNIDLGVKLYDLEHEKQDLIIKLQQQISQQQNILDLFKKFVPENVVQEIINENKNEIIKGEYRIASVMFVDIRDFTPMAERLGPNKSVEFLNNFFMLMSQCVNKNHGSINKYLGDGLLILFGAPLSFINNQLNAVMCGIEMLNSLANNVDTKINIGIGVHTGEVIVGNIGTPEHIEYTAIGDTVNLASRIEDLTRTMPNKLLISQATYDLVKNDIIAESLGLCELKGCKEKMEIYVVNGKKNE